MKKSIKIIPIGGIGEIGKNSTLLEMGGDLLLIDAGFKFPSANMPGVDFIIPDFSYLKKRKKHLKGILFTHGHMDHIGGLKYLLEDVTPPIIAGSQLALGLVKGMIPASLKKHQHFREVKNGDILQLGAFNVQFIRMTHSIPGSFGIAIKTPFGYIYHTGDYKIDKTPVDGKPMDIKRLKALAKEGVIALLSDSTNADEEGFTGSESLIGKNLVKIFREAQGRIIAASFSTNIHRIQQFVDVAEKFGRKVVFDGKSILESMRISKELGYIKIPKAVEIEQSEIAAVPKNKLVFITTGTQGEPMSGLSRISNSAHKGFSVGKGDSVVISADPIPGNEREVASTINRLFKLEANVYYRKVDGIHFSGHCSHEDIKFMINLLKPKYFVPLHGEYRHLVAAEKIANECGISKKNVFILENGAGVQIVDGVMKRIPRIKSGAVIIEGKVMIPVKDTEVEFPAISERREMAHRGMVFVVVSMGKDGKIVKPIHVESKGILFPKGSEGEIIKNTKEKIVETVKKSAKISAQPNEFKKQIEKTVKRVFRENVRKTPAVFVITIKKK
ncbi:MAG: ribonuclease J [Caldisericaceae bacterium]|nr:ribonuclease J [Caldisericaceae bacterium]